MSNPESSNSSGNEPKPSGGPPNKPRSEKSGGSHLIWYVLIVAVVALVCQIWYSQHNPTLEMAASEFKQAVKDKKFTAENVSKLVIGKEYITFEVKPEAEKNVEGKPEPAKKYAVPVVGMADPDRAKITDAIEEQGIKTSFEKPPSELPALMFYL